MTSPVTSFTQNLASTIINEVKCPLDGVDALLKMDEHPEARTPERMQSVVQKHQDTIASVGAGLDKIIRTVKSEDTQDQLRKASAEDKAPLYEAVQGVRSALRRAQKTVNWLVDIMPQELAKQTKAWSGRFGELKKALQAKTPELGTATN